MKSDTELAILSAGFAILSATVLFLRHRRGTLLSAAGGLHTNVFFFLGCGPLCYAYNPDPPEYIDSAHLLSTMAETSRLMFAGYLLVALFETWSFRHAGTGRQRDFRSIPVSWLVGLLLLAVPGYIISGLEFGQSSFGTIFPVLKCFGYPLVVLCILRIETAKFATILTAMLVLTVALVSAATSAWRSELIVFFGSIALGVGLRTSKALLPLGAICAAAMLVLLPFQNFKKINYEEVLKQPVASFFESQQLTFSERVDMVRDFGSLRINSIREIAYISEGIADGLIELKNGETYVEAIQQLVPRFLWPEKPSFNIYYGFHVPRAVHLLPPEDESTSWAVNLFAEVCLNFGSGILLIAPVAIFFIFWQLDRALSRRIRSSAGFWLIQTTIYFQTFQMVGVVTEMTYLLWTLLICFALDRTITPSPLPPQSLGLHRGAT